MEPLKNYVLTEREWRIVSSLREVPESRLRGLLEDVLVELTDYVREPSCPEVQADGVPCGTPAADCTQCLKLEELLTTLRTNLPHD